MTTDAHLIYPDWPAPKNVKSVSTTRLGGVSTGVFSGNNLALHVSDNVESVMRNRLNLSVSCRLPREPSWLNQTHTNHAVHCAEAKIEADASYSDVVSDVCVVMTADCLPILLCDETGQQVAAIHAGWRGLLNGVIENSLALFRGDRQAILAWMGPAIGKSVFEVGNDVYKPFVEKTPEAERYFQPLGRHKYLMDIYGLAKLRLNMAGVSQLFGGEYCTFTNEALFFSYRRDGACGRMGSLIWLDSPLDKS